MDYQRIEEEDMEVFSKQKLFPPIARRKGGLKTMPFIIVNEAFEKIASYGLLPNMIFYLMNGYGMEAAPASIILSLWSTISNALAIVGAFVSDSYMGRFSVILLGSFSSLAGTTLLWLTAMIPGAKPPPCSPSSQNCPSATPAQFTLLFSSFGLISIGAGCVRPCSLAFGADQLVKKENSNNETVLDSYFNWYYASIGISTVLALTIIVYIQDQLGWKVGFGVPAVLMLCSALMFLVGSHLYVKVEASKSLVSGFVQVPVAAFNNRCLSFPPEESIECYYYHTEESKRIAPTPTLRFLNKACIVTNPETDLNSEGSASNPWKLCTVDQVEDLKSLLKVFPMWTTGIMVLVSMNQSSLAALQANTMDRHITSNFQIPSGSYTVFTVVTLTIWVALYDRFISPLLAKFTGNPRGLENNQRMGIGLLLSCVATAVAAIVEGVRRKTAIEEGLEDNPYIVMGMSGTWLIPQFCLFGLAEAFNAVGQVEFFYSHFPKTLSSLAMGLYTLEIAVASGVGSLLVEIVDGVTKSGGKVSWLSSNLNKGHYDYFYWLLTFLGLINFLYFLVICRCYRSNEVEIPKVQDGRKGLK